MMNDRENHDRKNHDLINRLDGGQHRIGIDGLLLRGRDAGSLRYFELLLESLAHAEQQKITRNQYVVFAAQRVLRSAALPDNSSFTYQAASDFHFLPAALRQQMYTGWHTAGELDVLHTPAFAPPLAYPGKTIMTLFDLTFLFHPHTQKWTGRLWWNLLGHKGFQKAERIITISHSTGRDVCQYFDIPPAKVAVIYPYVAAHFQPLPPEASPARRRATADRYRLPERYILFVSTLERRKNVTALLHAFARAKRIGRIAHKLVLVGQSGWLYQDIFRAIENLDIKDQVILPGYVPESDLPGLYHAADLFAFLSSYEGFGFPVLEAMSCGTPVLASNASALPEVIGSAGCMIPPTDVEQAAAEMLRILKDADLREDMSQRGLEQAQRFSPEQFQSQMLAVYEQALGQRSASDQSSASGQPSAISLQRPDKVRPAGGEAEQRYGIPDGVQERVNLPRPALSTPQNGLVILDRPMLALWRYADRRSLSEITAWAQSQGRSPLRTHAALDCLAKAGLLACQDAQPAPGIEKNCAAAAHAAAAPPASAAGASISVILVSYNSSQWLEACLASLAAQTIPPGEIIIVDNASSDDSVAIIKSWFSRPKMPSVRLIEIKHTTPLSSALNCGIQAAGGEYYLLLNPDLALDPHAIEELLRTAEADVDCAAVAAKLRFLWAPAFLNGLGNSVGRFTWGADSAIGYLDLGQFDHWQLLPSACFAAALIPAAAFAQVGPIDENFPMYYEDSEWCYRARLIGYHILAAPHAEVYHALGSRIPTITDTSLPPRKLRHVVFGRLRFITKIVAGKNFPAFLLSYLLDDLAQFTFALLRGRWKNIPAYLSAWKDYIKSLPDLRRQRRLLQQQRKISDRVLFRLQRRSPIPLVWRGIPQLTWDVVQTCYLPLLHGEGRAPAPQLPSLRRVWRILRAEGFPALAHRLGRILQWMLSRP